VGDRIRVVNGIFTNGPGQTKALDSIVGPPGTTVELTIERPGRAGPFTVSVTRAKLKTSPVDLAMVPGTSFALIDFTLFSDGGVRDLRAGIGRAVTAGATGLILDLRGNPGGSGQEAVDVAGVFLAPGTVVVQTRDASGVETSYTVSPDAITVDLPLVVLVDRDSASSAEIVVGALQDAHRATIVGTATAGTGTTVEGFDLADGSQLWIGTEEWLTPAGQSAWHTGLKPDVEVDLPVGVPPVTPDRLASLGAKGLAASGDVQLLRAIAVLSVR
jgi:carboxyl-terminal processing protease